MTDQQSTPATADEQINFNEIKTGDRIPVSSVFKGTPSQQFPRSAPTGMEAEWGDYSNGMPYIVLLRESHRNTLTAVAYDPKTDRYARLTRADDRARWNVRDVGNEVRATVTDYDDTFEEHVEDLEADIAWLENEGVKEHIYDGQLYWDSGYDANEYAYQHTPGSFRLKIRLED